MEMVKYIFEFSKVKRKFNILKKLALDIIICILNRYNCKLYGLKVYISLSSYMSFYTQVGFESFMKFTGYLSTANCKCSDQ